MFSASASPHFVVTMRAEFSSLSVAFIYEAYGVARFSRLPMPYFACALSHARHHASACHGI